MKTKSVFTLVAALAVAVGLTVLAYAFQPSPALPRQNGEDAPPQSAGQQAAASGADSQPAADASETRALPGTGSWAEEGDYLVGQDIAAGEYIVENTSFMTYLEVSQDDSGELDSVVANRNIGTHVYLTLQEGQYFKLMGGRARLAEELDPFSPVRGALEEGMYKVGRDLDAGDYTVQALEDATMCYVEITSDSSLTLGAIVGYHTLEPGEETQTALSEGQYILIERGKLLLAS